MIDTRTRAAAAALLITGLVLSGCASTPSTSPSAPAEPATQAEQCAELMTDVEAIGADVPRVGELIGTDPIGALALVGDISARIGDLDTELTDPELIQRVDEIQAGWDAVVQDAPAALEALGSGDAAGAERIGSALTELGEQVTELQQSCTGTS